MSDDDSSARLEAPQVWCKRNSSAGPPSAFVHAVLADQTAFIRIPGK